MIVTDSKRIRGKIARINSDRELVVNKGIQDGLKSGDYLYVRGDPVDVKDPDTGEVLGQVSPIKIVVRVDEVDKRFCIARTFRSREVKVRDAEPGNPAFGSTLASWRQQLQPPKPAVYETRIETFRVDPRQGSPIDETDSVVQVGDVVESVLEGEDTNPVTTTLFR